MQVACKLLLFSLSIIRMSGHDAITSSSIAFASCNRQNKPQDYWDIVTSYHPDLFLWTGDSVYAKRTSVTSLEEAYQNLTNNLQYQSFAKNLEIVGVWDDHDYGVNDGGYHVAMKDERRALFAKHILRKTDPSVLPDHLYTTIDRQLVPSSAKVKIILLDTRSYRENHYIPSLGQYKFPLSPLIAAALRGTYSMLGFGRQYPGDVLGEAQWTWLEETLKHSEADFHVLVSSIQVFTSNPVVESWGHFPVAKQRLLSLLQQYDPQGLVLLSGDVHHGELSHVNLQRQSMQSADGPGTGSGLGPGQEKKLGQAATRTTGGNVREGREHWVEVTSSGLTHHCGDSGFGPLCPLMLHMFSTHRVPPDVSQSEGSGSKSEGGGGEGDHLKKQSQVFIGKNFGIMTDVTQIDVNAEESDGEVDENRRSNQADGGVILKEGRYSLKVSVVSVDSGDVKLTHIVHSYPKSTSLGNDNDSILNVIAADFPSLIPPSYRSHSERIAQHTLWITLFIVVFHFINMYFSKRKVEVG